MYACVLLQRNSQCLYVCGVHAFRRPLTLSHHPPSSVCILRASTRCDCNPAVVVPPSTMLLTNRHSTTPSLNAANNNKITYALAHNQRRPRVDSKSPQLLCCCFAFRLSKIFQLFSALSSFLMQRLCSMPRTRWTPHIRA